MKIAPFRLERYFAQYEFNTEFLLGSSDCESLAVEDLLGMEPGAEENFRKLWLGYTESLGHPELRAAAAGLYPGLSADQVLIHSGAEEAIFLFANAVLERGDHVIIHWPCYQSLYEVPQAIGCEISLWAGKPEDGWRLDLDELRRLLRPDTRAVLVNMPHNPTGYMMRPQEWRELVSLADRHGFLLFSDEVYRSLEYRPEDWLDPGCVMSDQVVSLNVLSKAFGLAGLRIGWVATRNREVYRLMAELKDYTTICNSAPSEFLGLLALRHQEQVIGRNREIIARNLALLETFFARHSSRLVWYAPSAGPIAFPALRGGERAAEFCDRLVNQSGVLLVPGDVYDETYAGHFRLGFGRANLPAALVRLDEFLTSKE